MTTNTKLDILLEQRAYVEAVKLYRQNTNANWIDAMGWLQNVAGQSAVDQLNQHLTEKRFEKLGERIEQLLKVYGMKNILETLIKQVDEIEEKEQQRGRGELPYLRLLSIDLGHTLRNYERRYDALESMEMDLDED